MTPIPIEMPKIPSHSLLGTVKVDFTELPVTALSDYALCPLRFKYRHVDGHLGYQSGDGPQQNAAAIGTLTHKALELKVDDAEVLAKHAPDLPLEEVQEALALAQAFHSNAAYQDYRSDDLLWEKNVALDFDGLTLNGKIDLVGEDFVLDFKTDRDLRPEHHQFQLWAYSKATGKSSAHLAYLRRDYLHSFDAAQLMQIEALAGDLIERLMSGDLAATASEQSCGICPFQEICDDRMRPSGSNR